MRWRLGKWEHMVGPRACFGLEIERAYPARPAVSGARTQGASCTTLSILKLAVYRRSFARLQHRRACLHVRTLYARPIE